MFIACFLPILEGADDRNEMDSFANTELTPEGLQGFYRHFGSDVMWNLIGMYLKHCTDFQEKYNMK